MPTWVRRAWTKCLKKGKPRYTVPDLKRRLYGTPRPSLNVAKRRMVEAAKRVVLDLDSLTTAFPDGFGAFASQVRTLRSTPAP